MFSLCVSVCLSVPKTFQVVSLNKFFGLSAISRSQFLTDFDEIWHRHLEPDTKQPFHRGSKSNNGIPYFYAILPQIGTYIMHFQWECWNTSLALSEDRL